MTLRAADIHRWDPAAVRAVAHAARARAQAAFDAADGLAGLPCLTSWGGRAATAAAEAISRTRRDLDACGVDALLAGHAAGRAAERIEALCTDLFRLEGEALALGLAVDAEDNRIVEVAPGREVAAAMLQTRLNTLVAEADSIDAELTAALRVDGVPVVPSLYGSGSLGGPLPEDPRQFHDLWQRLTVPQRDELYRRDPAIGNHPGMPTGSPADPGSDHYNRRHLAAALAAARAAGSEHRADLQAVDDALTEAARNGADTRLMLLDLGSGQLVHAAVAVGNPDTADHVSVTAPGLNSTVRRSIGTMTAEAVVLQRETVRQLAAAGKPTETVAAIAWIGYDAPQIPGPGSPADLARSGLGGYQVSHDGAARAGAVNLARFYDGIQGARAGGPAHLTAIGHSYGSLTTGLALQSSGDHGVSEAVFYGSPGVQAATPAQLNLAAGHVFAMATPDDPIRFVYQAPPVVRTVAAVTPGVFDDVLLGVSDVTGTGAFGPNPATNPNFVRLETGPAVVTGPGGAALRFDGAAGHSEYPKLGSTRGPDGEALLRTPGYNLAAVVAGLSSQTIKGD